MTFSLHQGGVVMSSQVKHTHTGIKIHPLAHILFLSPYNQETYQILFLQSFWNHCLPFENISICLIRIQIGTNLENTRRTFEFVGAQTSSHSKTSSPIEASLRTSFLTSWCCLRCHNSDSIRFIGKCHPLSFFTTNFDALGTRSEEITKWTSVFLWKWVPEKYVHDTLH